MHSPSQQLNALPSFFFFFFFEIVIYKPSPFHWISLLYYFKILLHNECIHVQNVIYSALFLFSRPLWYCSNKKEKNLPIWALLWQHWNFHLLGYFCWFGISTGEVTRETHVQGHWRPCADLCFVLFFVRDSCSSTGVLLNYGVFLKNCYLFRLSDGNMLYANSRSSLPWKLGSH